MPRRGEFIPLEDRFWPKVREAAADDPSPNGWSGCWIWTAAVDPKGYGHIRSQGRGPLVGAHRVAYQMVIGLIPLTLELDHLCRRPACVNPAHLEPVTRRENVRRGEGIAAREMTVTHCPAGHPYAGDNLYRRPSGGRTCRTCTRAHRRAYKARKRAAARA